MGTKKLDALGRPLCKGQRVAWATRGGVLAFGVVCTAFETLTHILVDMESNGRRERVPYQPGKFLIIVDYQEE